MIRRVAFYITGALVPLWVASAYSYYVAWRLAYHPSLGSDYFRPWSWYLWGISYYRTTPWILHYGLLLVVVSTLVVAFLLVLIRYFGRNAVRDDTLHGAARFASDKEIDELHMLSPKEEQPQNAVILGSYNDSYIQHEGSEHAIVFAPTRSGKGVSIVIPTLLAWQHSVVVVDIKGELWSSTSGWRKKVANNKVIRLDFTDDSLGAARFNPLEEIRLGTKHGIQDVANFVESLIGEISPGPNGHWDREGSGLLRALVLHTLYRFDREGRGTPSLDEVYSELNRIDEGGNAVYEDMLTYPHIGGKPCPYVAREARGMLEKSNDEQRGVRSTVNGRLKPFTEPLLAAATKDSTFRLGDIMGGSNPVSLYLVVPPSDIARLMPLVRIIIEMITMRNMETVPEAGAPKKRLLFLLDEFPALGKVEIFEKALAYMAGYGMQSLIITQDKSQIDNIYSVNNTIIGNCHIRVVYAPNDYDTAEWISDMLGYQTVIQEDNSVSGKRGALALGSVSVSQLHTKRSLMLPDEVMRLQGLRKDHEGRVVEPGEKIIFIQGERPILANHILYFEDEWLKERARHRAPSYSDGVFEADQGGVAV